MNAGTKKISDIFNQARLLHIPYYQRAYVWGEKEWEQLLDDLRRLSSNPKPYFIGSMILKQNPTPTGPIGDQRTVIDGQQRLTTITVFFKVLSLFTYPGLFDTFITKAYTSSGVSTELTLKHNRIDEPYFNQVLGLTKADHILIKGKKDYQDAKTGAIIKNPNQIILLYEYMLNELSQNLAKYNITEILNNVTFVLIDLDPNDDEQQIFDTTNSLGVRLTTSELLKNYFFDSNTFANFNTYWLPIFEQDKDQKDYWDHEIVAGTKRPHLIDLFFYAFLLIKIHDTSSYTVSTADKDDYMRMEDLFHSYKDFISKYYGGNKLRLVKEVNTYATTFMNYFDPDARLKAIPSTPGMERMSLLMFSMDCVTLLPYVLYILVNNPNTQQQNDLFGAIESYMMRRIICHSDTRNYNNMFYDSLLTNKVLTKSDFIAYINKQSGTTLKYPSDTEVKDAIDTQVLVNKQNTGILYMLESRIRPSASATKLLGLNSYSLEHLMPKKWQITWPAVTQAVADLRNDALYTLGNLAIIPMKLNTSISNGVWADKLNGKGNKPGLISCASGLVTLTPYLSLSNWDENEIQKRANDLYSKIVAQWKF